MLLCSPTSAFTLTPLLPGPKDPAPNTAHHHQRRNPAVYYVPLVAVTLLTPLLLRGPALQRIAAHRQQVANKGTPEKPGIRQLVMQQLFP